MMDLKGLLERNSTACVIQGRSFGYFSSGRDRNVAPLNAAVTAVLGTRDVAPLFQRGWRWEQRYGGRRRFRRMTKCIVTSCGQSSCRSKRNVRKRVEYKGLRMRSHFWTQEGRLELEFHRRQRFIRSQLYPGHQQSGPSFRALKIDDRCEGLLWGVGESMDLQRNWSVCAGLKAARNSDLVKTG